MQQNLKLMKSILINQNKLFINGNQLDPNKYLKPNLFWKLEEAADSLARNWYKKLPIDSSYALECKNIPLGFLIEYNAYLFFLEVLKSLVLSTKIIREEKIEQIFITSPILSYISSLFSIEKDFLYLLPLALKTIGEQKKINTCRYIDLIGSVKQSVKRYYYSSRHNIYVKAKNINFSLKSKPFPSLNLKFYARSHIMFIARGYQNAILYPILKKTSKLHRYSVSVIGDSSLLTGTLASNLSSTPCINLDYINLKDTKELNQKKKEIISAWKILGSSPTFQKIFNFGGVSFWDLVKGWFEYIFCEHFLKSIERIAKCDYIFELYQPKLLVGTADIAEFDKILIFLGKQHSIKSLDIQSGYISFPKMNGFEVKSADKLAVWGKETKETYLKCGINSKRIIITGAPRFDAIIKEQKTKKTDKSTILTQLGLDPQKKTILVTTQPEYGIIGVYAQGLQTILVRFAVNALSDFPNSQIIIKTHQSEPESVKAQYLKILSSRSKQVKLVTDIAVNQLLPAIDLGVTTASTTGLEALLFRKPLIIFNPTSFKDLVSYAEKKVAIKVKNYDELLSAIRKILTDNEYVSDLKKHQDCYLSEALYKLDGKSTLRVINLINDIISENNQPG